MPRGIPSFFTDEQVQDFVLKFFHRSGGANPSYLKCVRAGLTCEQYRFFRLITPEWKQSVGIPLSWARPREKSHHKQPSHDRAYKSPLAGKTVAPPKVKKPKRASSTKTAIKEHRHRERRLFAKPVPS